ncbi:unnamed protein product, partial [Staurois parvus]
MLLGVCCLDSVYSPTEQTVHSPHVQGWTDNSGAPGQEGIMGPLCPHPHPKKPMKRYQGHLMGPPTDPGPSGSARVPKWSVRPCTCVYLLLLCKQ